MDSDIKGDYILPFTKYLNKPKKSVSFEKKVEYEYTYGKDIYDRKPIEDVEQITIRELYELTLSRIEARKSNVYYSNQKPKSKLMETDDISECINDDSISEEKKVKIVSKAEQEKLNNMEVDELEVKSKNTKKIKLTNVLNNENNKTNKGKMNKGENTIQHEQNGKNSSEDQVKGDIITFKDNKTEDNSAKTEIITEKEINKIEKPVPKLNISVLKQLEAPFDPRLISPRTTSNEISTFKNKREREYMKKEEILKNEEILKKQEQNQKQIQMQNQMQNQNQIQNQMQNQNQNQNQKINPELISPRSTSFEDRNSPKDVTSPTPTSGNNVFLPNGEINFKNLPEKFVSPRRRDSKNRIMINSQLDLAHYKPPIKSLAEINDPNYEEKVGSEPVPYGSSVYYEEPEITSPNMENAIPNYHRPMIDYRNNLMNITNYNDEVVHSSPKPSEQSTESTEKQSKEHEKKSKEKKSNRKSLSIFNILKKSKSAENIKAKSRKSFFKPAHKNHSTPPNKTSLENKNNNNNRTSSPLSKAQNATNDNKSSSKNTLSRVTMFNKYQEPTIDDIIAEGPGFANNENKPMSKYALKTLKLRQSDSSLHVNTANLHLTVRTSPNHLRPISPISVRSLHSAHSTHSNHSAQSSYSSQSNEFESYHNSPKESASSIKHDSNISTHKPIISPLSKPSNTYVPNIPLD